MSCVKTNDLFVLLFLMALLMPGCSHNSKIEKHPFVVAGDFHRIASEFVEIDARNPDVFDQDELPSIVDSMFFVKLPDKPLLGTVSELIVRDSVIYLMDDIRMQVLKYDMRSNSLAKISSRGRGPNEYIDLDGISINEARNDFVINDGKTSLKSVFDLSGKFIRKDQCF